MSGKQWYKEMSVYQIWIRSFCDGNGDGVGDLYGVLQKLDYIQSLGVDAIWFSPLYPSPNADFGYDISDYCGIHPDYGDLALFQEVLDAAHERGLRVFMDLVVNHSSDEHPWFQESRKGKDNPYTTIISGVRVGSKTAGVFRRTTGPASLRAAPGSTTKRWTNTTYICSQKNSRI